MTVAEYSPLVVEDTRFAGAARQRCPDARPVLDTTELRWFLSGPLPADIGSGFTSPTAVLEERCDTYLLDGRSDVGVKRRFGEMLEIKVRRSLDGQMKLGSGLTGSLEAWRKWSPAEGLGDRGSAARWVDVGKSIVKRRFSTNGSEIAVTPDAQTTGTGCDVEIAQVTVGAQRWWTFAFAAFGPQAERQNALLASWKGVVGVTPCLETLVPCTGRTMGYPEWLTLVASPHRRDSWAHHPR